MKVWNPRNQLCGNDKSNYGKGGAKVDSCGVPVVEKIEMAAVGMNNNPVKTDETEKSKFEKNGGRKIV